MKLKGKMKEICIFISIITILALFVWIDTSVNAEDVKVGTVVNLDEGSSLNFRSGPGTEYDVIGKLTNGQTGRVLDEANAENGVKWYKLQMQGLTGWASSYYIRVTQQTVEEDQEFGEYLISQGFPASYHAKLQELHSKYPNWKFEAQITNLDWNEVIQEESKLGKNLTHTSNPSSWKSTESGAYDWTTGKWIGFDSSSWVAASTEIIQYYMDPRNFLDENYIFQFIRQSYDPLDTTYEQNLTNMVQGTFLAGSFEENGKTKTYVQTLLDTSAATGVSPYTLATMIIQEQGRQGTGGSISGKEPGYVGYYNFFNVAAFEVPGLTPVQKGLQYASTPGSYGRPWNTRTKSIMGGAEYFGEGYIKKGQDTIYLKKYNVQGDNLYYHQYMTNVQGAASEGKILSDAYDAEARKTALVFKIPVYKNMPESACAKPTGNKSPNYMLKSLSVQGQSLTPTFSMYETAYSLIVPNTVTSVKISAQAYDSNATISGAGTKELAVGTNKVDVVVKAENGSTRTYTITIQRKKAEGGTPVPTITSAAYKLDASAKTITGIKTFPVTASAFAQNLKVTNGSVKVFKVDGSAQTGNVGTGNVVKVYDSAGTVKYTFDVIIYGDASGDGRVNAQDLLIIQKNNIRLSVLDGFKKTAADVNRDGKVNAQDLLIIQKHNIHIKEIQQ